VRIVRAGILALLAGGCAASPPAPDEEALVTYEEAGRLYAEGRWAEAAALYESVLAVRDRIRDAYHRLARCRQELGDEAAAAEVLERALRVDRTDEEALRGLARLRERRGELGAALAAWRVLAALRPEDPAPAREVARLEALKGRKP
jgi:Flp pilus assembly protein TadD